MKSSKLIQTSIFIIISYIIAVIISIPIIFFYFDFFVLSKYPDRGGFGAILVPFAIMQLVPFVALVLSIPIFITLRSGLLNKALIKVDNQGKLANIVLVVIAFIFFYAVLFFLSSLLG